MPSKVYKQRYIGVRHHRIYWEGDKMIIFIEDKERKYINLKDWTCVMATTPPDILKSLRDADALYFKFNGEHMIRFV